MTPVRLWLTAHVVVVGPAVSTRPTAMQEKLDRIPTALDQVGVTIPELCDAEGETLGRPAAG